MFSMYPALKRHFLEHQSAQTTLPSLDDERRVILEPEGIISIREKKLRYRVIKEYLIKWKDLLEEEASWESTTSIVTYAEDKASFQGKGNVN